MRWTIWIITDTGRMVPHWTVETRQRARDDRARLVDDHPHLQKRTRIRKDA